MAALLLDFDGVLAPLSPDPAGVRPDPACVAALAALRPAWRLAIISGRSCADLLPRVAALAPDAVAGDHGLEIRLLREGRTWVHPGARRHRRRVLAAAAALGGRTEPKAWTAKAYGVRGPLPPPPAGVRYLPGRGGVDVLPDVPWDKGRAAAWILDAWSEAGPCVYVGDEATDEEAFRRLRPRGVLTVRVAPEGPTAAELVLPAQDRVAAWLAGLRRPDRAPSPAGSPPPGPPPARGPR
jgi:trehalose-6-phosphatase